MRRGTTPTLTFNVDADLIGWDCWVTLNNNGTLTTFEDNRLTKTLVDGRTVIEVTLTQAETLAMSVGNAEAQIRAYNNGAAVATDISTFGIGRILMDGVIPNV